jgi:dolichol-phosphate mannosyltransferase
MDKTEKKYKLSIIVPVYNEENNIEPLISRLKNILDDLSCNYEIIFSMDPSTDLTEKMILEQRMEDERIKLLKLSRRFGQPAATIAGIHYCTGDACVVIDADLQDPPELIKEMIQKWQEGYDVVYAQRISRKGETLIKRIVSYVGYWVINKISVVKIPRNTGDFRLISREVINELKRFNEHDPFLRGIVAYVGFSQFAIPYDRDARLEGKGKYNRFLGSLRIGLNGVLGFSRYPLHLISLLGLLISSISFLLGLTYLSLKLLDYHIVWGNPTLVMLISFLSGVQLLSLGIIGQYMARIFDEIKGRPGYIIKESIGLSKEKE